jgi:hypothetical protein
MIFQEAVEEKMHSAGIAAQCILNNLILLISEAEK